jgi:hypothetical protein
MMLRAFFVESKAGGCYIVTDADSPCAELHGCPDEVSGDGYGLHGGGIEEGAEGVGNLL